MDTVAKVVTEIICLGIRVRVWVRFRVRLSVNSSRVSFSVLLRTQHYSMLTTFSSVDTAFKIYGQTI